MPAKLLAAAGFALVLVAAPGCSPFGGDGEGEAVAVCKEARAGRTTYAELEGRLGEPDGRREVTDQVEPGWYEATWSASSPAEHDRETAVFLFGESDVVRGKICGFPHR